MRLVAEPLIPFALWLVLALVAIVVLVWYAWTTKMAATRGTRAAIVALMSLAIALPLIVLLNLTWIQNIPPPAGKPVVRVLVDTSASMTTTDSDEESNGETRLARAEAIATAATEALEDQFDVRVSTFDRTLLASDIENLKALPADPAALAQETNLVTAITEAIQEDIPQGQSILLLSDGIHNAGPAADVLESSRRASAMDVPIFTSTIGGKVGVKNVAVSLRSPQELAFVGQKVPVVASVESLGLGSRPIPVSLYKDGQQLQTIDAVPENGQTGAEVSFEISEPVTGLYRYEVRAGEVSEEATTADNRSTLMFRVVDEPIKMLLVEGKPYWDTKFLVRRLAADQSLELTSVIRLAEGRYIKRTVASSMVADSEDGGRGREASEMVTDVAGLFSADSLAEYQILVLGRNAEYFLTDDSVDNVRNWVARDGGSIVCARGAPSDQVSKRLGQILPVKWTMGRESRFRVSMTSQGKEMRWLANFGDSLGAMPSLSSVASASQRQGLSNVLAATVDPNSTENSVPVISYQPYGSGRTVVVEGAGMWRWALMSPEHADREEVYQTLWRSLLRWLVSRGGLLPGQDISLQPDRVTFDTNDVATATMLVRQENISAAPRVRLRSENKVVNEFDPLPVGQDPGVYRVDLGQLPAGQYELETISAADSASASLAAFDVRERWVERLELDARADLMKRIAESSGGAVLEQGEPEKFAELFQSHLEKSRPPKFRRVAMWDRWWVMGGLLIMWALTWVVRRRSGLV